MLSQGSNENFILIYQQLKTYKKETEICKCIMVFADYMCVSHLDV